MKAYVISLFLVGVVISGCTSISTPVVTEKGYSTELDETTPTEYMITDWKRDIILRRYVRPVTMKDVSGTYSDPMHSTSGFTIHLYPDGLFRIAEWIDIAPTFLVAEGTWKIEGNMIKISMTEEHRGWGPGLPFLRDFHGDITEWHLFVTADGERIGDTVLLTGKALEVPSGEYRFYLRRDVQYRDWLKERESLKTAEQWKREREARKNHVQPESADQ